MLIFDLKVLCSISIHLVTKSRKSVISVMVCFVFKCLCMWMLLLKSIEKFEQSMLLSPSHIECLTNGCYVHSAVWRGPITGNERLPIWGQRSTREARPNVARGGCALLHKPCFQAASLNAWLYCALPEKKPLACRHCWPEFFTRVYKVGRKNI